MALRLLANKILVYSLGMAMLSMERKNSILEKAFGEVKYNEKVKIAFSSDILHKARLALGGKFVRKGMQRVLDWKNNLRLIPTKRPLKWGRMGNSTPPPLKWYSTGGTFPKFKKPKQLAGISSNIMDKPYMKRYLSWNKQPKNLGG